MAQAKLWFKRSIFLTLIICLIASTSSFGQKNRGAIGITLLFQSSGMQVGVLRFDPDGRRGPVPGAVGGIYPRGGAQIGLMPGDSEQGIPKFVEVEWMVASSDYNEKWKILSNRTDKYSKQWISDVNIANSEAPHYKRRIDLTSIITEALVDHVRENCQNTQLKLIITFNNENIDIKALAYKWR